MQKKLSNIIRKAAFFMIPIASAICYAGISDDVYASSETTEDSLIYNFRDAKKEGTITFVKRWKDGKKEEDRNIPNIEISTKKPRKNVSGYTVIFHGNGMTFADGSTENEMLFNSSMNIIGGQYKVPGEAYAFWYTEPECINKVNVSSTGIPDLQLDGDINLYARAVTFVTKTGTEFNNAIPDNMTYDVVIDDADATSKANAATIDANAGQANVTSITTDGAGKATQKFYLQHGQQITVQGLAKDTTYAVTENTEDYKSTANTAAAPVVDVKADTISAEVNGTIASKDLTTGYLNTRDGVIPTGVIMAVAPFAVVTILGGAGVVTMVMKKNKKEDE